MTAREGMTNLILRLRGMTAAGSADYSVGGVDYWTDDQLQDRLDMARQDLNRVPLVPSSEYQGGTALYYDYYAPVGNLEEYDTTNAAVFQVEDGDGDAAGTADYTADYLRGVIRFGSDQAGTAWYIRARTYNMNAAASMVWYDKAAHYAGQFDVKTDNHDLKRSQLLDQALKMAARYEVNSGIGSAKMVRSDLV